MNQPTQRNLALAGVAGMHVAAPLLPLPGFARIGWLLIGSSASHVVLAAAWAALAVWPWRLRLPASLFWGLGLLYLRELVQGRHEVAPFDIARIGVWLCTFLVLLAIFTMARAKLGWRIGSEEDPPSETQSSLKQNQFGLQDILLWITGTALALAGAWWLTRPELRHPFLISPPEEVLYERFLRPFIFSITRTFPGIFAVAVILCAGRRLLWSFSLLIAVAVSATALVYLMPNNASESASVFLYIFIHMLRTELWLCTSVLLSLALFMVGGWQMRGRTLPVASKA